MEHFKYDPISLTKPAFRLLRLLKGDGDPIQCQLFESKLTAAEDYAAISYTWGGTSKPCDIVVNGYSMTITKNAYLALRDMRRRESDRILWVDALCINQDDDEERSQQVQQMGAIYSQAERVLIWLGEPTYDTDYVMRYMKLLEERIEDANTNTLPDRQWETAWLDVVQYLRLEQKEFLAEGFQLLLHRDWFNRVWIVQETANARHAEIICGTRSIPADVFSRMPSLLGIVPDPHCLPILDLMPGPRRQGSWWAEKRDLHTLLVKFQLSMASDPRDNIYALLDISSDAHNTDLLRANYNMDDKDISFNAVAFLLDFGKLDPQPSQFFRWHIQTFLENLDNLASWVLSLAMHAHLPAVVKLLITRDDVDVNTVQKYSTPKDAHSPFMWAAKRGHDEIIETLLQMNDKAGFSHEAAFKGRALQLAIIHGHESIVSLILQASIVDINWQGEDGRTALHYAVDHKHESIVKLLLGTEGIDVKIEDRFRRSPLTVALSFGGGDENIIRLLRESGG